MGITAAGTSMGSGAGGSAAYIRSRKVPREMPKIADRYDKNNRHTSAHMSAATQKINDGTGKGKYIDTYA